MSRAKIFWNTFWFSSPFLHWSCWTTWKLVKPPEKCKKSARLSPTVNTCELSTLCEHLWTFFTVLTFVNTCKYALWTNFLHRQLLQRIATKLFGRALQLQWISPNFPTSIHPDQNFKWSAEMIWIWYYAFLMCFRDRSW